jgi:hypothetical protein
MLTVVHYTRLGGKVRIFPLIHPEKSSIEEQNLIGYVGYPTETTRSGFKTSDQVQGPR